MKKNKPIMDACDFFRIPLNYLPSSNRELLEDMDRYGVEVGVILGQNTDSTENPGFKYYTISNEWLYRLSNSSGDRLIPFAGVDPNAGNDAVKELKRALKDLGFRGLKIHSSVHSVYPNDKERMYPLYEICQEYSVPVLLHTGTTGLGRCRIKFSKPEYLDDVCQDFPDLKIIMAHFGWPWSDVAIAIALRSKNVYLDISGWLPRYIPENVVSYINGPLKERFLFGTDYPMIRHGRWVEDFNKTLKNRLKEDVLDRLLYTNAKKLLFT